MRLCVEKILLWEDFVQIAIQDIVVWVIVENKSDVVNGLNALCVQNDERFRDRKSSTCRKDCS